MSGLSAGFDHPRLLLGGWPRRGRVAGSPRPQWPGGEGAWPSLGEPRQRAGGNRTTWSLGWRERLPGDSPASSSQSLWAFLASPCAGRTQIVHLRLASAARSPECPQRPSRPSLVQDLISGIETLLLEPPIATTSQVLIILKSTPSAVFQSPLAPHGLLALTPHQPTPLSPTTQLGLFYIMQL